MKEEILSKKRVIIIISILLVFISFSLAYIIPQISDGAIENVGVTADTTDDFQFNIDKEINLNPNQFNVTEGGGNLTDTAIGSAILRANSTNNTASYTYYVYFSINSNDYIYTTVDQKPEIILTITNPNGEDITEIEGLNYVKANEVSGFDITTKTGLYEIANLYEIASSSSTEDTTQNWTFTVSFINLDTNQSANGGKSLEAEIILSKDKKTSLANYIVNNVYTGNDGDNGIYYHDGTGTYVNADQEAGDYSYRYSGANPNNYVCFGTDITPCPEENLYRIIGVFDNKIKLIKNLNYQNLAWDEADPESGFPYGSNNWQSSTLKEILNNAYLSSLGNYSKYIAKNTAWFLGGISTSNLTPKEVYLLEIGKSGDLENTQTDIGAVGLMHVSDYGYAASPSYWTYVFHSATGENHDYREAISENWLYSGKSEWTLTVDNTTNNNVYSLYGSGKVDRNGARNAFMVRAVIYLNASAIYSSGDGTINNPYTLL